MMAFLLLTRGAPPPSAGPWIGLILFLVLFPLLNALTSRLMGIPALYAAFPADPDDPIEENLGWQQVNFGGLRGHSPMAMKFGRRCLHLKQPFPFQAAWWLGPASIPWAEVRLVKGLDPGIWSAFRLAEFQLGREGRLIRLGGKAARRLQARLEAGQGAAGPFQSGAIRPR
jgi:hypothetical protein